MTKGKQNMPLRASYHVIVQFVTPDDKLDKCKASHGFFPSTKDKTPKQAQADAARHAKAIMSGDAQPFSPAYNNCKEVVGAYIEGDSYLASE